MKTKRSKLKKRRTKKNQSGGNGLQSVTNYRTFSEFMDRKIHDELDISRDLDLEEKKLDLELKDLYKKIKDDNTKEFIDKTIPKRDANIYEIDKAIETFKNYKAAQPTEENKYFDAMVKKLDINYYRHPIFMNESNKLFAQKVIIEVIGQINTKSESFIEGIKHGFSPLITKQKILLSYMIKYVRTLNKKYNFSQDFLNEIPGYMEAEEIIQTREKETKEKNDINSQFWGVILREPNESFVTEILKLYDDVYNKNNNSQIKINSVVNLKKDDTMKFLSSQMSGGASDPRDLIAYLNSEEVTKEINDPTNAKNKEAMLKRRNEAIEILKKQASTNHVDYEIDNFFRLFFPKASATAPPKVDDKKKVYETKEELITYMFSYPIDSDTFKEKGKEANQENNPFGFDINVRRSDSSVWSEMMGIEAFLLTLNASGSNTNYFSEYYKKPMFTNKVTTTKRIPNYAYSGEKI